MKRRVLWIEDSGYNENVALTSPVTHSGRYDMLTVMSATDGLRELARIEYDAIIVDIRIIPGEDPRWIKEYVSRGRGDKTARLGLRLLEIVLGQPGGIWHDHYVLESARRPLKYGVLTVEAKESLQAELDQYGVIAYRAKHAGVSRRLLLELIDEVVKNSA
jgi:hypothetical protein